MFTLSQSIYGVIPQVFTTYRYDHMYMRQAGSAPTGPEQAGHFQFHVIKLFSLGVYYGQKQGCAG